MSNLRVDNVVHATRTVEGGDQYQVQLLCARFEWFDKATFIEKDAAFTTDPVDCLMCLDEAPRGTFAKTHGTVAR